MDDLLADFLTETNEGLAELDAALLRLERAPGDHATLSLVFRVVHTIKGTCGFLGLARLEAVTHAAETVLGRVRDRQLAVTPELISLVLRALDEVNRIVAGLAANGAEPSDDDAELIARLHELADGGPSLPGPPGPMLPEPAPLPTEVAAEPAADGPVQSVRVGVDVLETLMTLVSELVLARNQLLQIARDRDDSAFSAPLQRLSNITTDLQEGVMKTRMQPIGNAWSKLPRLVRDLANDLGKHVELHMHGQATELDRQVIELIRDPLTHMIRNSMDHGLETPEERRLAGKSEVGRIQLSAYHEGGRILIEISDDGRGLPLDRIRAKALSRGFATEAELVTMTEAQLQRLIFRPGFSTAASVTSVSGRGVGMDVVKTNIERIGGTIELRSKPGEGTWITITIPLTLAIVSALIVEAAGERFAIPQAGVVELVHTRVAGPDSWTGREEDGAVRIEYIEGSPILRLRDRLLPLVSLADLLQLPAITDEPPTATSAYIVVTAVGAATLGVIVDRVFDTEEIVVKPVAPILRHITMFSGNTILGDGSVIMILDPNGIARASGVTGAGEVRAVSAAQATAMQSEERTSILLFRAGSGQPRAVPLGLVSRLEHIPHDRIEGTAGRYVTQYRGQLMPLVCLDPSQALGAPTSRSGMDQQVLVFTEAGRSMGLAVDEILDVVTERLHVELSGAPPGVLGTAVVAGRATEVLDAGYWLMQAGQDWFFPAAKSESPARILCVEDSDFFRQMLIPMLSAAGYQVSTVSSAERALALQDAGVRFDAIISDIEMTGLGGLDFARRVRAGGTWAKLPLVALSARAAPADIAAGRAAGFTDYVTKLDRAALLSALQRCLCAPTGIAR